MSTPTIASSMPRGRATRVAGAFALFVVTLATDVRAGISIYPGFPSPTDTVIVELTPFGQANDCLQWRIRDRYAERIVVDALQQGPGQCPNPFQTLELGRLDAGRYTVEARLAGETKPLGEVRFDVRPSLETPPRNVDVALSDPSPLAGQANAVTVSVTHGPCDLADFNGPPQVVGDRIVIDGGISSCPIIPLPGLLTEGFHHPLPPLTAGDKTLEVRSFGGTIATVHFHVDADTSTLPLFGGVFTASLLWTDRAGVEHQAHAARLTDFSGQFWFFVPGNPEVTVKLIDGLDLNQHYWVFASSMTDLAFTLTVESSICFPGSCVREKRFTQLAGHNRNFIDVSAFPVCTVCSPSSAPAFSASPDARRSSAAAPPAARPRSTPPSG